MKDRAINLMDYGVDVYGMFYAGTEEYTIEDAELRGGLWNRIQTIYEQGNVPVLVISMGGGSRDYYAEIQGMTILSNDMVYWINTTLYVATNTWIGAAIGLNYNGGVFVHRVI